MTLRTLSLSPFAHRFEALAYAVSYEPCFEPYVVVDKTVTPLYDERFRGYAMNKASFTLYFRNFHRERQRVHFFRASTSKRRWHVGTYRLLPRLSLALCGACPGSSLSRVSLLSDSVCFGQLS